MIRRTPWQRLQASEPLIGIAQTIPSAVVTELAIWCGYDFVMLDCEHGPVDEGHHLHCLQIIAANGVLSCVRVRPGDCAAVGRYLNWGANVILMADVRNTSDAAAFVAAATTGHDGTRSSSSASRVNRYGLGGSTTPGGPMLLAMIEGADAVSHIEAIIAMPGLAGVVIGPNDLSADLGCGGDFSDPRYRAAFVDVETAALHAPCTLGSSVHAQCSAGSLARAGHTLILAGSDLALLRDDLRARLDATRADVAP
jgi:2-keto-3-deoxy-L-rhamnonate aldolase RhmA